MLTETKNLLASEWNISQKLLDLAEKAEIATEKRRKEVRELGAYNQLRVLNAFKHNLLQYKINYLILNNIFNTFFNRNHLYQYFYFENNFLPEMVVVCLVEIHHYYFE